MFRFLLVTSTVFMVCLVPWQVTAAELLDFAARHDAWRKILEQRKFSFPEHYSGLLTSLRLFSADVKIHVIFDPKDKWWIEFKFVRDGQEILSLRGHDQSAFVSFEDSLYFAKYSPNAMGCRILAYNLTSGKKLWETELHHEKPHGHSGYANYVTMRLSYPREIEGEEDGAAIVITGMESYCDYVEVLDRQTGKSLAIKNYRTGFGPPPPAGGAFGGEEKNTHRRANHE